MTDTSPAVRPAPRPWRIRAYVSRRRTGTALKLWITDAALAHLETSRTLSLELLGEAPSRSVLMRLAARCLAEQLQRLAATAEAQRQKHGRAISGPETLALKLALVECRGAAR